MLSPREKALIWGSWVIFSGEAPPPGPFCLVILHFIKFFQPFECICKMEFTVETQKRGAVREERFCAKAYIVTHVNNENIVICPQI